jgi:hypothetical protein
MAARRLGRFANQTLGAGSIVLVRLGQMGGWDFFGDQQYGTDYLIEPLGYAFGNIFNNHLPDVRPGGRAGCVHSPWQLPCQYRPAEARPLFAIGDILRK